jgi:hypothetical protein
MQPKPVPGENVSHPRKYGIIVLSPPIRGVCMARNSKPVVGSTESQQEEMTVVVFKFKGGPESMQKGFDAVNSAIAALGPGSMNIQRVIQRPPAQIASPQSRRPSVATSAS